MNIHRFLLAFSFSMSCLLHARTLTVDNNPGSVAMFKTFHEAYNNAVDGDTILVAGSPVYYTPGEKIITKRLSIVGPGYDLDKNQIGGISRLPAKLGAVVFSSMVNGGSSSGSRVSGVQARIVVQAGLQNILVEKCANIDDGNGSHFLSPVLVRSCYFESGPVIFDLSAAGSVITNCLILNDVYLYGSVSATGCVFGGAVLLDTPSSISNSIFTKTSHSYNLDGKPTPSIRGQITSSLSVSDPGRPDIGLKKINLEAGLGNINSNLGDADVFSLDGTGDRRFRLKPGSIALGAGTDGSDMGAFGGASPYKLSGVPAIPRLTHLIVPSTATSTSGLRFEVEAQAFGN